MEVKLKSTNTGNTSTTTIGGNGSLNGLGGGGTTLTVGGYPEFRMGYARKKQSKEEHEREQFDSLIDTRDGQHLKPRRSQAKRQWSIQAVKGKVTNHCLWNACKALTVGILLIFVGAGMSAIGYYADEYEYQRSLLNQTEIESDLTIHPPLLQAMPNKTNSKPTHEMRPYYYILGKFSYIGPVIMGAGGFIIVAACVMTFEARDSAAKIVPARFRKALPDVPVQTDPGVRHSAAQTKLQTLGVYGPDVLTFDEERELNRTAMTSAFIRFSKNLQSSIDSCSEYYDLRFTDRFLIKCPSAPSLIRDFQYEERKTVEPPRILRVSAFPKPPPRRRLSSNAYPRQAMSVDNPAVREVYAAAYPSLMNEKDDHDMELGASATGVDCEDSDASLALDLHLPQCAVTLTVKDNTQLSNNSTNREDQYIEAIAGPSGIRHSISGPTKVDKQTSTSDYLQIGMLDWLAESWTSRDGQMSCRATAGGSFRDSKRPKAKKVKRSETIDTATSAHGKHHRSSNSGNITETIKGGSNRTAADGRHLTPSRSETARRHQLLRQQKIEATDSHDLEKKHYQV